MIIAEIILHIVLARFNYLNNWNSRNELWCRDSLLGWYNAAKADEYVHGTDFHSHVRTDENGFRLDEKQTGNAILLIGDSFVQACEVDDNETFGYILEQMTDFNVINAGVAGYGTDQEMLLLERILQKNDNVKHVILFFYINDLKDIINNNINTNFPRKPMFVIRDDSLTRFEEMPRLMKNKNEAKKPEGLTYRISELIKNLLYKSAIYRVAVSGLQFTSAGKWLYSKNLMNIPDYMSYDWRLADNEILEHSLPVWRKLIKRMDSECMANNTSFTIILIPSEFTYQERLIQQFNALEKLYKYSNNIVYAYECIASILEDENIDYIYPLNVFKREQAKGGVTFRFDKHFNERGHKLMAEILEDYINESGSHR